MPLLDALWLFLGFAGVCGLFPIAAALNRIAGEMRQFNITATSIMHTYEESEIRENTRG